MVRVLHGFLLCGCLIVLFADRFPRVVMHVLPMLFYIHTNADFRTCIRTMRCFMYILVHALWRIFKLGVDCRPATEAGAAAGKAAAGLVEGWQNRFEAIASKVVGECACNIPSREHTARIAGAYNMPDTNSRGSDYGTVAAARGGGGPFARAIADAVNAELIHHPAANVSAAAASAHASINSASAAKGIGAGAGGASDAFDAAAAAAADTRCRKKAYCPIITIQNRNNVAETSWASAGNPFLPRIFFEDTDVVACCSLLLLTRTLLMTPSWSKARSDPIRYGQVRDLLPFDNSVYFVEMNGEFLNAIRNWNGGQLLTAQFLFITGIEHHRYMLADKGLIAPLPTVPTTEMEAVVAMRTKVVASAGAEWGGLPIKTTAWYVPLKRTLQHADPTF